MRCPTYGRVWILGSNNVLFIGLDGGACLSHTWPDHTQVARALRYLRGGLRHACSSLAIFEEEERSQGREREREAHGDTYEMCSGTANPLNPTHNPSHLHPHPCDGARAYFPFGSCHISGKAPEWVINPNMLLLQCTINQTRRKEQLDIVRDTSESIPSSLFLASQTCPTQRPKLCILPCPTLHSSSTTSPLFCCCCCCCCEGQCCCCCSSANGEPPLLRRLLLIVNAVSCHYQSYYIRSS
jgi:hypothetical protein